MNEIEQKFYDAYIELTHNYWWSDTIVSGRLQAQVPIDIYVVDFMIDDNIIVEIDGHEYHKTKEQRFSDYQRERYFLKRGYVPIRFTGSEVFVDPQRCVIDAFEIAQKFSDDGLSKYMEGFADSVNEQEEKEQV